MIPNEDTTPGELWMRRRRELSESMPGFNGLILAVQGLLVGVSLATGEIWVTPDIETTRSLAYGQWVQLDEMIDAWGIEQ